MVDVLKAAKLEKAQIERQIKPLQQRVTRLDAFISEYYRLAGQPDPDTQPPRNGSEDTDRPFREVVIDACERVLDDGSPKQTRVLISEMLKLGLVMRGKDPVAYLSAILSTEKDRFVADRKYGWSLVHKKEAEGVPPPSASGLQL